MPATAQDGFAASKAPGETIMKRTKTRRKLVALGILLGMLPVAAIVCDVVGYDPYYVYDVYYVDYFYTPWYYW